MKRNDGSPFGIPVPLHWCDCNIRTLPRLYVIVEPYNKYNGFEDGYIMVGVFWIVAAPFAFAVFFAKYGEKLKKRGKTE